MTIEKNIYVGVSGTVEYVSINIGDFCEELSGQDVVFIKNIITCLINIKQNTNKKYLYVSLIVPIFGKNKILNSLRKNGINYQLLSGGKETNRVNTLYSRIKEKFNLKKVLIIECTDMDVLSKTLSIAWGYLRLVFFVSGKAEIPSYESLQWIEYKEKPPIEFINDNNFVITQFFHGVWLEIISNKFEQAEDLFDFLKECDCFNGRKVINRNEW